MGKIQQVSNAQHGEHNGERQGGNKTKTQQRVRQEMEIRERSDFENILGKTCQKVFTHKKEPHIFYQNC